MKLLLTVTFFIMSAFASADVVRATTIRVAPLYLSPDTSSTKLADVDRGREVIYLETSNNWVHVEANLTEERTVTGWIEGKGLVQSTTPDGDKILFGKWWASVFPMRWILFIHACALSLVALGKALHPLGFLFLIAAALTLSLIR